MFSAEVKLDSVTNSLSLVFRLRPVGVNDCYGYC